MNRKRVQMLRDMLAGIPQERIHLDLFYTSNGKPCRTIACIAGWAAIYPPFMKQGLIKHPTHPMPMFASHVGGDATAQFFGVPYKTFEVSRYDEYGTHKQIALRRLDKLLDTGTDSTTA